MISGAVSKRIILSGLILVLVMSILQGIQRTFTARHSGRINEECAVEARYCRPDALDKPRIDLRSLSNIAARVLRPGMIRLTRAFISSLGILQP